MRRPAVKAAVHDTLAGRGDHVRNVWSCPSQRQSVERRWKIALVLETSGGGSGRHVIDLAGELSAAGHEIHIIYSGLRLDPGFGAALKALAAVRLFELNMRRLPHPSDLLAAMRLRRYVTRFGPFDIVHGHSSKAGAIVRLAALGKSCIRVYTPHAFRTLDPDLRRSSRWLYATAERILSRISTGIILVSEEERQHAISIGLDAARLFVVENGLVPRIAPTRAEARKELGLNRDELIAGFVGRFVPQKAPELAVRAFATAAQIQPEIKLVMLGEGPLESGLHDLAEELGVADRISWVKGYGPDLMPAFDLLFMTSRYEAFPYVLVEAAAAGLPIITTPVGGTSAVVRHGTNGLIVSPDADAIARDILALFKDPSLRDGMSSSSAEIAKHFTVKRMVRDTCNVYKTLLAPAARDLSL